ncbi:hypothetical protein JL721_10938 [Aureococcus anophagefferens]|nr:hypothetical protein JL721_10938 [Aureococcus anophagefferens]
MRRVSVGTLLGRREEDVGPRTADGAARAGAAGAAPRVSAGQPKAPVQRSVRLPGTPIDGTRARSATASPAARVDGFPGRRRRAARADPARLLAAAEARRPRRADTALDEFEEILGHVRRGNDKLKKTAAKARRKSLNLESRTSEALPDAFGSRSAGSLGELPSVKKLRRERHRSAPVLSSLHELERERAAFEESTAELEKLVGAAQTVLLAS